MKRFLPCALLALLFGCSSPTDEAQSQYRMAEKAGDKAEMCRQARAASDAFLKAQQQEEYERWALLARASC